MSLQNYSLVELFEILIIPAMFETFYMMIIAATLAIFIGGAVGTILFLTDNQGLTPNKSAFAVIDTIVNIVRSFPFTILVISIIPLTRGLVGTSIGSTAAIVPLTISSASFMARTFQNSLNEVDDSLIEAGRAFGLTVPQIVTKIVYIEAVPSLISGISLGIITLLSQTAAAGAVGAGGLGATALTYGYQSFNYRVMYSVVILLIVIVAVIQLVANMLYKKAK